MDHTEAKELQHVLETEAIAAERLLEILQAEQQALADGDADRLEDVIAKKHPLVQQLEALSRQHQSLLTRAGLATKDRNVEKFLTSLGNAGPAIAASWQRIRDAIEHCREQNQRNGRLVVFRRRKTEQALNILLGGSAVEDSYGPDGSTTSSATSSRPLTSI